MVFLVKCWGSGLVYLIVIFDNLTFFSRPFDLKLTSRMQQISRRVSIIFSIIDHGPPQSFPFTLFLACSLCIIAVHIAVCSTKKTPKTDLTYNY